MLSDSYIKAAIKNVEEYLDKQGRQLRKKVSGPSSNGYRPELDVSPELGDDESTYFQELIGILRWAIELGRVDIMTPVALLSQYLASPRQGHLEEIFHIMAYLKHHGRSKMVFDDTFVDWGDKFPKEDWCDFYGDIKEPLPDYMPEPRGHEVQINCFVDADHAGNKVTRRSHTGIIIYLNRAPVDLYSKKQNTVETSSFGSEFVAMRVASEKIQGLRFKLRMMGIPLTGPANVFGDNNSVVQNSSRPESTLKKKHLSICFHCVRECVAMDTMRICYEPGKTNLADLFTKLLPGPAVRELASKILF